MSFSRRFAAALAAAACLTGLGPPAPAAAETAAYVAFPTVLTLEQALQMAQENSPALQLAALQVASARASLEDSRTELPAIPPVISDYLKRFGLNMPATSAAEETITLQSLYDYERAVSDYYSAQQKIRSGTLQAYVEWQKALAIAAAQEAALEWMEGQEKNVEASVAVGMAAPYDLVQVQTAVSGQQAAVAGARAAVAAARSALEQLINVRLPEEVQPEEIQLRSESITLPLDLEALIQRGLTNRPDLRSNRLDLASQRIQSSLLEGTSSLMRLQAAASQYELAALQARTEITQTYLAAQGALEELRAREKGLETADEALRLAELRYEVGLSTWSEVQNAAAARLEAEAGRIQAASNVMLRLFQLRQAVGDL